nr:ribonuclease H-like domain-containing protein [Tanacetum cinerariifolium]
MNLSSMQRRILEATFISMWWHIWKFRNLTLFSSKKPQKDRIFVDIVSHTYFWLSNRYVVPTGRVVVPTGRESKARTTLLQSIPDDHVADFHYIDDARDIWNAVKARFGENAESKKMRKSMLKQEFLEFRIGEVEGLHKGYDRMQKILSQLNQLKSKPEDEDINLKFLRALPSSWSQVALTLKTKGGLELLSFDDLYYKLKTLDVDVKGYTTFSSSQSAGPSHYAFVSTTNASKKMSYGDSPSYSSTTTYTAPSNSKTGSHRSGNKAGRKIEFDKKESARANGGNNKQRYSSFKIKEIEKKEEDSKALITVDTLVDWTDHDGESDGVIASKEFGMITGCDTEDAIKEGAAKIYNLITGADTEETSTTGDAREFALMGVTSELHNCPFGYDNKLIDSSMSVRTKVGLGFNNYIMENELGWDDSAFSVFTTNSEDVEGRPLFNRFAKADSMKAVLTPLSGDYTSLSDHIDLDESHMSYGTKSSTSSDSKSVSNDFVSCDDSDKSSEVNTNDFAFSDSSIKSSELKPNNSTSCASTSSLLYFSPGSFNFFYCLMVQEGGLVIFKCSTWTKWPYFDDKAFILVVQVFPLVLPEFLLVLFDSHKGGKGSFVWHHQHLRQIRRWRLYTLSNVYVLETISGEVVYKFADVPYPFSVKLMERMLKHKLEIAKDVVGNDITTAEQLIQFIKNQLADAQVSPA